MPLDVVNEPTFICPGETHPISRSVHLARMASFYPGCRDCPFRSETGHLPQDTIDRLQQTERRAIPASLFQSEGVRGVYLNELSRRHAELIAASYASVLWSRTPLTGCMSHTENNQGSKESRVNPSLVVGYDERPSAPDVFTGVTQALRRMSCDVVDIGLTTKPAWQFAVEQFGADGGVMVTGSGCDPSRIGLDFVRTAGMPISREHATWDSVSLTDIEDAIRDPYHRPTRQAGAQTASNVWADYVAERLQHFPMLAPFRIVVGCSVPLVMRAIATISEERSYEFVPVAIPRRVRRVHEVNDVDVGRVANAVHESQADLGMLIDDDGQRFSLVTERGELLAAWTILPLIAEFLQTEVPRRPIVLEPQTARDVEPQLVRQGITWTRAGQTHAEMFRAMQDHSAVLGGGASGRVWVANPTPTSDALLILAHLLTVLTRRQISMSRAVALTSTLQQ